MKKILIVLATFFSMTLFHVTHFYGGLENLIYSYQKSIFWYYKTYPRERHNFFILGDSRSLNGIDPDIFAEMGDKKFNPLNLAYLSNSFLPFYLSFVESKLQASPSEFTVLLLGITPQSLSLFSDNESLKREIAYFGSDGLLAPLNQFLRQLWPPLILNQIFKQGLTEIKNNQIQLRAKVVHHSNGWIEVPDHLQRVPSVLPNYRNEFQQFKTDEGVVGNLLDWVQRMRRRNILVFAFYAEPDPEIKNFELDFKTSHFNLSDIKRRFLEKGGQWIDKVPQNLSRIDGDHLFSSEARKLSRGLREGISIAIRPHPRPPDPR